MQLLNLLLGRPLATREQSEQKIGVVAGVAALGLDGLSSAAYGPEALLAVLMPLGAAEVHYVGPVTVSIIGLLTILYFSYRQTIAAYPAGGGSYTVAKDNLGTNASLWAAAALMLDYICGVYGIGAMDQGRPGYQSVLSQLVAAVFGRGAFYYFTITNLLVVLCLSANTSFVDFPRLSRLVATDGFLPCSFALYGRRLVNTVGIVFLAGTAAALLIGFGGITEHLIPLYAVGAFLAFTLSQAGMVCHWRRQLKKAKQGAAQSWVKLAVNGVGAAATGGALVVILAAKFREGAWVTVLAFPVILGLFKLVKRYYKQVDRQMRTRKPLDLSKNEPPVVVVPIHQWNKLVDKALRFAVEMSPDVIAVHLFAIEGTEGDAQAGKLRAQWAEDVEKPARTAGLEPPRLEIVQSPYRKFFEPLMELIGRLRAQYPRRVIAVLVPDVVKTNWWQFLLHNYRSEVLRSALLRHGDHRLVVVSVPWYVEDPVPTLHRSRPAAATEALRPPPMAHDGARVPS